jgi:NADH-quinone oxidoreductase subunit G
MLQADKKLALVSPSMSLQQVKAVKEFCQTYDIDLFSLAYIDESFGDDWLKTNDVSANFSGVKELNINSAQEVFDTSLENAEVVINFDHTFLKGEALNNKRVVQFTTSNCDTPYELIFAIANFAHEGGTIINCDGIRQDFYATKYKNEIPTLVELLGELA